MVKQLTLSLLFRYLFLYSLLGYSAFLTVQNRVDASAAVLGGTVALLSFQNHENESNHHLEEEVEDLQRKLMETQHEVGYYQHKLIEADLRQEYQDVVNDRALEINNLKLEKDGLVTSISQEAAENRSKEQKISILESENTRLKDHISKMEKERILTMKRSILKADQFSFERPAAAGIEADKPLAESQNDVVISGANFSGAN